MAIFAWGNPEPNSGFLSSAFLQGGPQNAYEYRNPDATLLIADAQRESDQAKRIRMLQEAEALILTDAPAVPLYYYATSP
jgi:ABC-type transport system substrate-binding protein